jgi:hypothetical protein
LIAAAVNGHPSIIMETKVMQPKIRTKSRLNADSYKIRKKLSFDNLDGNILVLEKVKKASYVY